MYDVFHLSFDEPGREDSWQRLHSRIPHAVRVQGVEGIRKAHARCAELSRTSHFFVVDADADVIDFNVFRFEINKWDVDYVHLWYAKNPANRLVYGWGGIKLFPKKVFEHESSGVDMTTSFPLKVIPEAKSISRFNATPLEAWRSAFRECAKLSRLPPDLDTNRRLRTWLQSATGMHADHVIHGAAAGFEFGQGDDDLSLINDYAWLEDRFTASLRDNT